MIAHNNTVQQKDEHSKSWSCIATTLNESANTSTFFIVRIETRKSEEENNRLIGYPARNQIYRTETAIQMKAILFALNDFSVFGVSKWPEMLSSLRQTILPSCLLVALVSSATAEEDLLQRCKKCATESNAGSRFNWKLAIFRSNRLLRRFCSIDCNWLLSMSHHIRHLVCGRSLCFLDATTARSICVDLLTASAQFGEILHRKGFYRRWNVSSPVLYSLSRKVRQKSLSSKRRSTPPTSTPDHCTSFLRPPYSPPDFPMYNVHVHWHIGVVVSFVGACCAPLCTQTLLSSCFTIRRLLLLIIDQTTVTHVFPQNFTTSFFCDHLPLKSSCWWFSTVCVNWRIKCLPKMSSS